MSFFKYYGETRDSDGEPLWWPGGPDGFPFRGRNPPITKETEYEQLQLAGKFRNRVFYLDDAKDARDYMIVRDKCANGLFALLDKDRQWDAERKTYRIYIEWLEIAYEGISTGEKDAIKQLEADPNVTRVSPDRPNKNW